MKHVIAHVALVLGLSAALAGCGAQAPDVDDSTEDLSASKKSFVSITHDTRKCASPVCGGYFVQDINKTTKSKYVASFDFSQSNLEQDDIDSVMASPPEEVVLFGKLGKIDSKTGTRAFIVTDAYLGLPGVSVPAGTVFYTAQDRSPAIQCITAPCNNGIASRVNATASQKPVDFTSYSASSIQVTELDTNWVTSRMELGGAIVAGSIVKGQMFPGGPELVLDAAQVFIKLPEVPACPKFANPACPSGKIMSWTRQANRCLVPDHCVAQKPCSQLPLNCMSGYHDVAWKVSTKACNEHACDPDFLN
jgi:hypothetical protein